MPNGNGDAPTAELRAVDRISYKITETLHRLFGFQYARNEEFYTYRFQGTLTPSGGTTPAGSLTGTVRITQEADFVLTKMAASTRFSGASASGGLGHNSTIVRVGDLFTVNNQWQLLDNPWTVKLTDGSNDRVLMSDPVDARLLMGDGYLPFILPRPRLIQRNSNISIEIASLYDEGVTDVALRVEIAFIGWKVFDTRALDLTTRR
jgi:hypothetical protein